jgi:flagellar hook-associated protein 1 FlgK
MGNLFAALRASGNALDVFGRGLDVAQNNVSNSSTPGYARQRLTLQPAPFDPAHGLVGGVRAGDVQSSRDEYAESAVRGQTELLGRAQQIAASLGPVESSFDVTGNTGIPAMLTALFNSFSAWSVAPNDPNAQQTILAAAQNTAHAFNQASTMLGRAASDANSQIGGVVDQINSLASRVQQYNTHMHSPSGTDASLDADLHATLEQLSELANINVLTQSDGSITLLLGGRSPLVVGANQYTVSSTQAIVPSGGSGPPSAIIQDAQGNDITANITAGKLGGLLEVQNSVLASLRGDGSQQGDLNTLAQGLADRVNQILTNNGAGPGLPLFDYSSASDPTQIAAVLQADPTLQPGDLSAADPTTGASNGLALTLAGLAHPQSAADEINGLGFVQFYSKMAANVGGAVADAKSNQDLQNNLVAQAKALRDQSSAVSLDDEAISMLQYQRSYSAVSRIVSVISEMTQDILNVIS